jgi:hypothetical protein
VATEPTRVKRETSSAAKIHPEISTVARKSLGVASSMREHVWENTAQLGNEASELGRPWRSVSS